jgi:transcriptional regulator NrdR family protein
MIKKWIKKIFCQHNKQRLVDERKSGDVIYRKYQCPDCGKIFEVGFFKRKV